MYSKENFINIVVAVYTSSVMSCPDSWSLHSTAVHHPAVQPRTTVHSPKGSPRECEPSQKSIFWFTACNSKGYKIHDITSYTVCVCTCVCSLLNVSESPKKNADQISVSSSGSSSSEMEDLSTNQSSPLGAQVLNKSNKRIKLSFYLMQHCMYFWCVSRTGVEFSELLPLLNRPLSTK